MKSSVRRTVCVIGGLIYGLLCSAWQPHALEEGFQRHALKESMTGSLFASDKLSGGLITCVCQDRYGFIWVGTEYGLNKFDGYRFTTYFHSRQDSATLVDNEISTIYMDRQGRLWVGCSKGLTCYDYEHDNFHRFAFPDQLQPRVNALTETHEGKLLIGTGGYGIYSLNENGHLDYESPLNKRQSDHFCNRLHIDRYGHLWHNNHLAAFTRYKLNRCMPTASVVYQSEVGQPMQYVEYNDHQLLIVCMYGILCYDYQTDSIGRAPFDLSSLKGKNVSIEDAALDSQGCLYLATSGCGLLKINPGSTAPDAVEFRDSRIDLRTANVVDVTLDREQNLWAACYNKGVLRLSRQQSPFSFWDFASQQYVTGAGISSITENGDGNIWCTVQNGGVFKLNQEGRIIAHPSSPAGTRLIFRSGNGQYWLTTENTLYRYQPETGAAQEELTLKGRGLNCVAEDQRGRLYISAFGMGLYIYDPQQKTGERMSMTQTQRPGGHLCNDWIKALAIDHRGLLWIATTSGVSVLNTETGEFGVQGGQATPHTPEETVLLDGVQCYALCEIAGGDMLIGTERGLYRYHQKEKKVKEVPHSAPLHDKMICAMVSDRQGDVWISTSMGLWQYQFRQEQISAHPVGNGSNTKAYVQGAMARGLGGDIYFGTADGVVRFQPSELSHYRKVLGKAILTRFVAGRRSQNIMQDHFELAPDEDTFTLEFSLLDFSAPENISFQYRINGSGEWMQTAEGSNQLTFIQMKPGHYQLEVRATDGATVSESVTTLYLNVRSPWYKTWWANVLYILAVLCFIGLMAYGWRSYQQEKQLNLTIDRLKKNMRWLHGKIFGHLEEKGEIKPVKVKGNDDALMERIVKCINENLSDPEFSVETLTQEVGISRAHLHRKMKELTGVSTSEFIRNLRLEQATRLIREKKINITQITYSVGFNNQAHFSTIFKKRYGMTPTEYAKVSSDDEKENISPTL